MGLKVNVYVEVEYLWGKRLGKIFTEKGNLKSVERDDWRWCLWLCQR